MDFAVLGPIRVRDEGRDLALGGPRQRALLAILLLRSNEVVARDRLIDELWGEAPPATARKALQLYVSRLRKVLGPERFQTKSPGYALRVDEEELDLARFERLRARGRHAEALALWRGPALADLADEPFAQIEIPRLEELRLACLEDRIDDDLAAGRHLELVAELESLVRAQPLRERLHGQLILALYRSGRQAEALEAYRAARGVLVEEFGIEPSRALRDLQQAVLEQDPELDFATSPAVALARRPFVGRVDALAELDAGRGDAFAGRGRVFLVAGEPGIGKSRLADEVLARGRARGAVALVGRCWEVGGAPAYWPWIQALRAYVQDAAPEELRAQLGAAGADVAQLVPEIRERVPGLGDAPAAEAESARFRLFDAVTQFLGRAAEVRPLVLVLDDLHAADAPSLLLLRFLSREIGAFRLLVVAAYRDVDPAPAGELHDALTAIAREPTARRLTLRGLSRDEVGELARLSAPAPVAADALWERTDGNPLFVSEMLRLRSLDRADDQRVPDTVRDVIARRLAHLSEACRRVLLLAAVMGRDFTLGALAGVAEVSEEEVLALLEPAMHDRVVTDVPGMTGRLRFAHVLIRDTLYDGLTPAGRMRLHRLTLAALERRYRDRPGPHLAELAHHALAGGAFKAGVRYARLAGDHALSLLAYEESARLFEIALQALAAAQVKAEESARCELLLSLGEARSRAGSPAAARSAFLEAAEIAQRLGLARALGRAAAGYGGRVAWVRVDDELLIGLLERAIEMLGDDEPELRARLLARLAGALRDEPTRERRDRLSAEAVRLARQAKSSAALLFALDGRVNAIVAPDTLAECLALADEQRSLASRLGDRERALQACMNQMQAQFPLGDVAGATRGLDAAAKIAKALGEPPHLWQVAGVEAMLAIAAGRLAEADELVERAFAIGQRVLPDAARTVHALQRCTLLDFGGVPDQARAALADVVATHPARPALRCALAYVDARAGHAEEAGAALADLVAAGLPFDQEWLFGMSFLAETATLLGERAAAAALYPALRPWSVLNVADQGEGIRGAVARYLGLLAPLAGHPQDAESHFEAAIEMNTRMGARPWLALARSELAALLLERGEVKRAAALRAAATAGFSELAVPESAAPARGWG